VTGLAGFLYASRGVSNEGDEDSVADAHDVVDAWLPGADDDPDSVTGDG
jgi:hypothetical protein